MDGGGTDDHNPPGGCPFRIIPFRAGRKRDGEDHASRSRITKAIFSLDFRANFYNPGATPKERLRRRQVAKDPARPGVQAVLDGPHLGVRHFPGKSVPFGRYPLTRPLVCPVGTRSQEWYGRGRKKSAPTIVSASRSPTRALPSTTAGRPGCPPGPGCGPGPRGPRPSGSASFPGGADAARAGPRPCGRRGRAAGSTDAPPSDGPPGAAAPRPAPGSSPRPAAPPPCATAPASSSRGPTGPLSAAPRPSAAPARDGSRALPGSGAPRARPSSGHGPAGGRPPRRGSRFSPSRGSGISRGGSGGAGPSA